jgi:hypothetical protein
MNTFQKQLAKLPEKAEIVPPKTFKITIEEHVTETFEVEAANIEEAMETAQNKYNNGEFVLEPGEVITKLMMADDGDGNYTEWTEF